MTHLVDADSPSSFEFAARARAIEVRLLDVADFAEHVGLAGTVSTALRQVQALKYLLIHHNYKTHYRNLNSATSLVENLNDIYLLCRTDNFFPLRDLDLRRELHSAAETPRDFISAIYLAKLEAESLSQDLGALLRRQNRPADESRQKMVPTVAAMRLAGVVVRILPTANRDRYREEFISELYELAYAGASKCSQIIYSARLFNMAWVLRAELGEATARRAPS